VQVRTSGIKLLFDIMTRHAAALDGAERRVWGMAFPLLMEVAKNVQPAQNGSVSQVRNGSTACNC
jgi:hypothetical protein